MPPSAADTICALATPPGRGALAIIRVSGPRAALITRQIARFLPERPESHKALVGILKSAAGELDQAVLTYFAPGRSFTGEETVEICCHGGGAAAAVLEALLAGGARPAEKGEFSLRAFLSGKIDLAQAEGILQLTESESAAARSAALSQLKGDFSRELEALEKIWLSLLSHIEADIDFSLEGLSLMSPEEIKSALKSLRSAVEEGMLPRARPFEKLQKGLLAGIFGPVNSGKSSLFNALLGEEKAVVSGEPGATRDLVEGVLKGGGGLNISLRDTAGARPPPAGRAAAPPRGEAERRGWEKALALWKACDIRALVIDAASLAPFPAAAAPRGRSGARPGQSRIFGDGLFGPEAPASAGGESPQKIAVFAKKDLCPPDLTARRLLRRLKAAGMPEIPEKSAFFVSARTGEGIPALREKLLSFGKTKKEGFFISGSRHYKGLLDMRKSLERAERVFLSGGERDLTALELREGLLALQRILGREAGDGLLDSIFSRFCIGK